MILVKVLGNLDDTFFDIVDLPETEIRELFPDYDLSEKEEFTGKYKADEGACYYIKLKKDDEFMNKYKDIFDNAHNVVSIGKNDLKDINCILCKKENSIYFQRIYGKNVIKRPYFYYEGNSCQYKTGENIVSLTEETDIYFEIETKTIYFKNYTKAKGIIKELENYYRIATDAQVDDLFNKNLLCSDGNVSIKNISIKRKIAQMLDDHIFDDIKEENVKKWKKYAQKYSEPFPSVDGRIIKITSQQDITHLYDAVYENYYTTDVTNQKRKTNSWKKI